MRPQQEKEKYSEKGVVWGELNEGTINNGLSNNKGNIRVGAALGIATAGSRQSPYWARRGRGRKLLPDAEDSCRSGPHYES